MAWLLLPFAVAAGVALPVQFSINAQLRAAVGGPVIAAMVSFVVGAIVLAVASAASRSALPSASRVTHSPWWVWTGGALGAFYVLATIVLIPRIGAGATTGLILAGQVVAALVLDHYGLLHVPVHRIGAGRAIGAVLVIAGVALIRIF
jgi:transporter family-2 protein